MKTMNINKILISKFSVFLLLFSVYVKTTQANDNVVHDKKSITEIAKVYHASMVYIFNIQSLINNKSINKEGLFGQSFIGNIQSTYKEMFNQPFPKKTDKHISNLLTLMMLVMEDNRTLLLDSYIEFKGFIPAIFAFQLSQKFKERGFGLNIKFTNFEDRVRNKLNSPDYWEQSALAMLKEENIEDVYDKETYFEGKAALRYMRAVEITPMCLNCHGVPQDNPANADRDKKQWHHKDKTGFLMEGWKLGELGGGISVVLYQRKHNVYENK